MSAPGRPRDAPRRGKAARAALAAGLLLLAAARGAAAQENPKEAYLRRFTGRPAPPFSLPNLEGREVRLSDQRGKVVLLNYWYSGCFPCRAETPDLIRLYRAHKDRGFVILGINLDPILMPADNGGLVRRFVQDFEIPYPTLIADMKVYADYGKPTIAPLTLLVDRSGTIGRIFWGAYSYAAYESALRPYLESTGP